jgi:cell division protein FtsL
MRTNLVLLVALVLSAIYLVGVQYDSRRHFVELDRVNNEARRLAMEHERLQVERRAQATPARVERLAREKLDMRPATAAITTYVNYSAPVGTKRSNGTGTPTSGQPATTAPGGWPQAPSARAAGGAP